MSKALVLVGMSSAETAAEFCREISRLLRENDGIPIKLTSTTKYSFETPNVEVRFIYDARVQNLAGLRADAIYGVDEYRRPLYPYAKSDVPRTPRVGLRDWIVAHEKWVKDRETDIKTFLNAVYGREACAPIPESLIRLASDATKVASNAPFVTRHLGKFIYREENTPMSIPPYVMALANQQGPATIHAGGMSIPVKIMDIDSESHPYKGTETSLRCMVVNTHDIRPNVSSAELLNAIMQRKVAEKAERPAAPKFGPCIDIDRVKFGKTSAVYWKNGDKTSIVWPEGFSYSKHHMLAMLFNLRQQGIAQAIFNNPEGKSAATTVRWEDGTKVTVRCQEGDVYSPETGLYMCIAKRMYGTNKHRSDYYDVFKKWIPKPEPETPAETEETDVSPEPEQIEPETPAETEETDVSPEPEPEPEVPEADAAPEALEFTVEEVAPDGE